MLRSPFFAALIQAFTVTRAGNQRRKSGNSNTFKNSYVSALRSTITGLMTA
jgi:hypothetical protein